MAREYGPIWGWERGDSVPTSAEGGYAGAASTAAAVGMSLDQSGKALGTVDNLAVTASTLDYGQEATATISGTSPWKTIHVGIPKGMPDSVGQQLVTDAQVAAQQSTASAADAAASVDLAQQARLDAQNAASLVGAPASEVVSTVVDRMLVDAKAHGVMGDGTTADAAALNTLISDVSASGGGVIVLPDGIYMLTAVNGASNVTVRGATREGAILRKSGSNSTWIKTLASTGFVLEHLTIDGANLVTSYGVEFSTGSTDCAVRDCNLLNFSSQTVETRTGSVRPVVQGCHFSAVGTGVRINQDPVGAVVRGCHFTDWVDACVYVLGSATYATTDALIEGNIVERHRAGTSGIRQPIRVHGDDANHHRGLTVRGNIVTGSYTNHQDTLDPGSADLISLHRCTDFEVSGNTVRGGGDVGITIAQGCRDGRILGNTSEDNDTVGLCLGSADSAVWVRDIVVSGNTFRNNAQDRSDTGGTAIIRAVDRAKSGVLAVRAQDCVIDGNSIIFDVGHPTAIRNGIADRECARLHIGAIGRGNKSTGHTAGRYSEAPASTGMSTTGDVALNAATGESGRLTIAGTAIIVGSGGPDNVVVADRGAVYLRTAGAAGPQIYYKNQSGNAVGWVASSTAPTQTTANLSDMTHPINTVGKAAGVQVFDSTSGKPLWAANGNANGVWRDATGTAVITPS